MDSSRHFSNLNYLKLLKYIFHYKWKNKLLKKHRSNGKVTDNYLAIVKVSNQFIFLFNPLSGIFESASLKDSYNF